MDRNSKFLNIDSGSKKTHILGFIEKSPIILCCVEEYSEFLSFYCEHCEKKHFHGIGDGFRFSHCINKNSPFFKKEYYLIGDRGMK